MAVLSRCPGFPGRTGFSMTSRLGEARRRLRRNTRRVMKDLVSVSLRRVNECGDPRALLIVRAPQTFGLCTHSASTPERNSGRSETPPSAARTFPQPLLRPSPAGKARLVWTAIHHLCTCVPSLALMPAFSKVIFLLLVLKSPSSPVPQADRTEVHFMKLALADGDSSTPKLL